MFVGFFQILDFEFRIGFILCQGFLLVWVGQENGMKLSILGIKCFKLGIKVYTSIGRVGVVKIRKVIVENEGGCSQSVGEVDIEDFSFLKVFM